MRTHPAIGSLKVFGWIFLLGGTLIGIWYLASIVGILSNADRGSLGLEGPLVALYLQLAIGSLLFGGFMWALSYVFAIIAEGTLANGQRLSQISRQLAAQSRTRTDTIGARVRRTRL